LGDPTAFGNIRPCPVAISAIVEAVQDPINGHSASYIDACGLPSARQAIADFHATRINHDNNNSNNNQHRIVTSAENVIIANGCSGALELAITACLESNSHNETKSNNRTVLLIPNPGFPLYNVIAQSHGAQVCYYPLLPHRGWEIDTVTLHHLMQTYTSQNIQPILVMNNPSNPTGAVFTKSHLVTVLELCEQFHVPVIADEVYGDLVLNYNSNNTSNSNVDVLFFHPIAHIVADSNMQVPVITTSGLAKQFLLPGWRLGWIIFQDKYVIMQYFFQKTKKKKITR
jgi:tyrosine aminotransferase